MATATLEPAVKSAVKALAAMAKVHLGDTVLWYDAGDVSSTPIPAIITEIGAQSLNVAIFTPNLCNHYSRDAVRHMSDPHVRRDPHSGGWDFHPNTLRLEQLEEAVAALERQLTDPKKK